MRLARLLLALAPATAVAGNDTPIVADEPSAQDVAAAPLPGDESGRTDPAEHDSTLRTIGQGALLVPRVAVEVTLAPVRASIWTFDRYRLVDRFKQVFFDDTETYGLYPTAVLDSSYGLTVGARFVHRNLFGEHEHLALRAATGGEYRAQVTGGLRTGTRLGERAQLQLRGELERRPHDAFYGTGNTTDGVAAFHRQELLRGTAAIDLRAFGSFYVGAAGAVTDLDYGRSEDGMPIDMIYDPTVLVGWAGVRNVYAELALRWDQRHVTTRGRHHSYDGGWLLAGFAGRVHQLEASDDYWRYGGDVQYHLRIGKGPRALATRVHLDAVTGDLDDVAFTQLPELGGKVLLRGYPRDRFRDRIAVAGSVEYEWDLSSYLMASLFVDAGRVFPDMRELVPTDLRAGYGVTLQFHNDRRYVAGVSLASSIDGGVFIDLTFDPVFDVLEPRVEQR